MINPLQEFQNRFSFLSEKEMEVFVSILRPQHYSAGDTVFKIGDKSYSFVLVVNGLLRTFSVNATGDEKTVFLAAEGMGVGCYDTIFHDEPSTEQVVALEETHLLEIDSRELERIGSEHPGILKVYNICLKANLGEAIERLSYYTRLKPNQRYEHLLQTHPELIQRVPQKYLASYLGMTPVSLSRIRNKHIRAKNK